MYVWSLLVIMMMGFTSCGDDELQFSEERLAYIFSIVIHHFRIGLYQQKQGIHLGKENRER